MNPLAPTITWVPFESLARLTLALFVGLFVGLEREWRGKDAGLRTFGLAALLGGMGSMIGAAYALASLGAVALLVVFLNMQSMRLDKGTELTTSAALFVTALAGVLCGIGHTITPVAIAVVMTGLLSWKERLADFGHRLTAEELRSAILLGILAFAIYPVLPAHAVDPWGLVEPRVAWTTVILIAGMGLANYILWKIFGTRGIEFAGFLGGLVNSTVTATELATRAAEMGPAVESVAYRGLMLSVAAMAVRNALILGVFRWSALVVAAGALGAMFVASVALAFLASRSRAVPSGDRPLALRSPFSLWSALKFGGIFLAMQIAGAIAQAVFGRLGFYAVSLLAGLVSSASAVASAAQLAAAGRVAVPAAAVASVLASLASAGVNFVLVSRLAKSPALIRKVGISTALVLLVGIAGALVTLRMTG
jgi:uncharacterized membrane protein (DUF4010 family)